MNNVWPLVHAERTALLDDLADLTDAQWDHASLCAGWSVRDVAAHLVNNAKATRLGTVRDMVWSRFDFDRQSARGVERERGATPQDTLGRLRTVARRTSTPPVSLESRLVEEVVHGEDIRIPLGIRHTYPTETVLRSIRYLARTPESIGGAKKLVARVRLRATDADLTIGDGPEVSGPVLSLLLAIEGRDPEPGDLDGPGVAEMK